MHPGPVLLPRARYLVPGTSTLVTWEELQVPGIWYRDNTYVMERYTASCGHFA